MGAPTAEVNSAYGKEFRTRTHPPTPLRGRGHEERFLGRGMHGASVGSKRILRAQHSALCAAFAKSERIRRANDDRGQGSTCPRELSSIARLRWGAF